MKNFFYRKCTIVSLAIILCILAACASVPQHTAPSAAKPVELVLVTATAVVAPSSTPSPTPTKSPTLTPTVTPTPTTTPGPTSTPQPTATATPLYSDAAPAYTGTRIPETSESISAANFQQLTYVAQWGNGSILGAAFAPDGQFFVVGSAVGFAVYASQNLDEPPRWVPLAEPYFYESIAFSADGNYLLFENQKESRVYFFANGQHISDIPDTTWVKTSKRTPYNDPMLVSADGARRFESYSTMTEDGVNAEIVVQKMYDNNTGELLYQIPDETMYVQYHDYREPEGCDLSAFSMCGNAFNPSAMQPYRAAFSPTGNTFSVLYRASNLWNSARFSVLGIYRATDGQPLTKIGDFSRPVATFAYTPDGQSLLVGYGDGSIELWHIAQNAPIFAARHFDAPIIGLAHSFDGQFVVVQRTGWVEVRSTDIGIILNRYQAGTFALSPVANLMALGNADGTLLLQDIVVGEVVSSFSTHESEIYALAFSPDGGVLTSSGRDCHVRSWDTASGAYLHDFAENVTDAYEMGSTESRIFIKHMKYISGTDQLLGFGSWSRVVSWQADTGNTQYLIEPEPLEYYNGMMTLNPHFPEFLGFNPDNQSFLIDSVEYDLETGKRLGEYQPPDTLPAGCAPVGPVTADHQLQFTRGYDTREGQICILDAADLQLVQVMASRAHAAYDPVDWLYLLPDGKHLLISTFSGVIHVYQIGYPGAEAPGAQ